MFMKWQSDWHKQCDMADRHVNLSTVMIKHLQGLVYWVNDCTLHQQLITAANFTVEQMNSTMNDKIY
jgi:hypothetical protein